MAVRARTTGLLMPSCPDDDDDHDDDGFFNCSVLFVNKRLRLNTIVFGSCYAFFLYFSCYVVSVHP